MFGVRIARRGDVIVREQDRQIRLRELRQALSASWLSALEISGSNELDRVPAAMVAGLLRIAEAANDLADQPTNTETRRRLRAAIDEYLRDVEIHKGHVR